MFWFSIFSLALFIFLAGRTIQRILKREKGKKITKEYFLLVVFSIHIVVILYLLD